MELTDTDLDGKPMMVPSGMLPNFVCYRLSLNLGLDPDLDPLMPVKTTVVRMVPTGSYEWVDLSLVEIWVPEDRLALWRAEHQVDPE